MPIAVSQRVWLYGSMGLLAMALAGVVGWSATHQPHIPTLADAQAQLANRQPQGAIEILKGLAQASPNDPHLREILGEAYLQIGDTEAAAKEFRNAVAKGGDAGLMLKHIGQVLLDKQKYAELLDLARRDSKTGDQVGKDIFMGQAYLGLKQAPQAEQAFQRAAGLAPADARPLVGLARAKMATGDSDAAQAVIAQALKLEPRNVEALMTKAQLFRASGQTASAKAVLDKALDNSPSRLDARQQRAELLLSLNDLPAAKLDIDAILRQSPALPKGIYLSAWWDLKNGHADLAEQKLIGIESALSNYMPFVRLRGEAALALQHYEQASYQLERYINSSVGENDGAARKTLASAFLLMNKPSRALDVLHPMDSSVDDMDLLRLLMMAYRGIGDTDTAGQFESRMVTLISRQSPAASAPTADIADNPAPKVAGNGPN